MTTNLGLDQGYSDVKGVAENTKFTFPSIVGTPEQSQFSVRGTAGTVLLTVDGKKYNVGRGAVEQSRFTARQEDRAWIESPEYRVLMHAAFSMLTTGPNEVLDVVTGLPVAFYDADKGKLRAIFEGEHIVHREGRIPVAFLVQSCTVIPQGMGSLVDQALNDEGQIAVAEIANGHIGVIDIGGKTTNLLHARKLDIVTIETDSVNLGGWDAVRAMRRPLEDVAAELPLRDHEVADAIVNGSVGYKGYPIDLSKQIEAALDPLAREIVSKAKELWPGGGAQLDAILLAGGGALLLGNRIEAMLNHGNVRVVEDSVFANARGYYKFGLLH